MKTLYYVLTLIVIVTCGFLVNVKPAGAQGIVIVKNFDDPEIDSLQLYLSSMGLVSTTINKDTLTFAMVETYDLLIWDDLSYQANGITDSTVSVFKQFNLSGKPMYFIGDDLAYSIINLSPEWASVWTDLLHLEGVDNFSQAYTVVIQNNTHAVTNGPFGQANSFEYDLDIDLATRTNTGEQVLAATADSDVLIVYQGPQAKRVTQNCLVIQAGSDSSISERKKIFKNAVAWLLNMTIGIREYGQNLDLKKFSLSQNYPNPFNPVTNIKFDVPVKSDVKIVVMDITGRTVAVLFDGNLAPGAFETSWDAGNNASGVYFIQLSSGNFRDTKKMVLVK